MRPSRRPTRGWRSTPRFTAGDPAHLGPDWLPDQTLPVEAALAASTRGPALASGWGDVGHLHPGARADLAILSCDLGTILEAGPSLGRVGSFMTMVGGTVVHGA